MVVTRRDLFAAPCLFSGGLARQKGDLTFEQFGAIGDGNANDTSAINAAIAVGALSKQTVVGRQGARYRVRPSAVLPFVNPVGVLIRKPVCVTVSDGASVDFRGSTLECDTDAVAISNLHPDRVTDTVGIKKVKVVDRSTTRTVPLIWFSGCRASLFEDIRIEHATYIGACFTTLRGCSLDRIEASDVRGQGIILGGNTIHQLDGCAIGQLRGERIGSYREPHQPGNPILVGARGTRIAQIDARDCGAGVKITANSRDLDIIKVSFIGGRTQNSGLKIQGDPDAVCRNIRVGRAMSRQCVGSGLFLQNVTNCSVGEYLGEDNGRAGRDPDIWINGDSISIMRATSVRSGRSPLHVRNTAGSYSISELRIVEPNVVKSGRILDLAGGRGTIGTLVVPRSAAAEFVSKDLASGLTRLYVTRVLKN